MSTTFDLMAQAPLRQPLRLDAFQRAVVGFPCDRSLVVCACAGSGKSTTLALRVQTLLQQGVRPETIMVLTFSTRSRKDLQEKLMSMRVPAEVRVLTHHAHALLLLRKLGSRVRVVEARESTALLRESFKSAIPSFDQASKTGAVVKRAMARIHTIKSKIATASQLNAALAELSPLEQEVCSVCVCVCFTQALIHHTAHHHPTLCTCVCFHQSLIHNPTPPLHATTLPTSATRLSTPPTNPAYQPRLPTPQVFLQYARALSERGLIDFDDMIHL